MNQLTNQVLVQKQAYSQLEITDEVSGRSEKLKVSALVSAPRLGFTDHHRVAQMSLNAFGIPLIVGGGAWWEHTIQNELSNLVDAGVDIIVTLDYDSIFWPADLQKMLLYMVAEPEIDALVPLQLKRGSCNDILCGVENVTYFTPTMYHNALTPIDYGHFGLTVLRAKALKDIPKPWFLGIPNENGDWHSGQTNPDIYFWKKFKEHGKKAFLANQVRIGHIDEYLIILDSNNQIKRYKLNDYMLGKFDRSLSNE
jgi:hypothetical protein